MAENSIDSCVTDPPYHLTSIVKRFGSENAAPAQYGKDGAYARASVGFMGKQWDGGDIAFRPDVWLQVYRVLKPGAHLLAFGGTRTYHRMVCAIEDAGFEIRDCIQWIYGSGFPKSHNQKGDWEGWGTALKPANEPIVVVRKPLSEKTIAANVMKWGTGALNIDGCRVPSDDGNPSIERRESARRTGNTPGRPGEYGSTITNRITAERYTENHPGENLGRWPANIIHDGSEEVLDLFPETKSGTLTPDMDVKETTGWSGGSYANRVKNEFQANSGSAARFFYCAKANKNDRLGSKHPTVKPIKLISYLCRLVTPPNGVVLDPFAGTGTLASACHQENFGCVLVEREDEYITDIKRRISSLESTAEPQSASPVRLSDEAATPIAGAA
jgi:site-specific DNA-methyltransferase (adenine-specific)